MYRDSLDGIRSILSANFPEVTSIYISTVPEPFDRPSFFVRLDTDSQEHLSETIYQVDITWRIICFPALNPEGEPDALGQLQVSDQLKQLLMENMTVVGPSGTVYYVVECKGEFRDNEVNVLVRLQAEVTRTQPEYELMNEILHQQEGED